MQRAATPETIGEANRMLILNYLRKKGKMSRADLSRSLSISFPAISSNVKSLLETNYIREVGAGDNSLGRKSTLLAFNEERGYVIGVDLGRFLTRINMADLSGNSTASLCEPTEVGQGTNGMIKNLVNMLSKVVEKSGKSKKKVLCICIGIPGVIREDKIILAPFLPDFSPSVLIKSISLEFATDIVIENSVNLGAIGEKWKGSGKKFSNFGFINYGVGVGSALMIDGKLYKGANGAAGEIGFMVSDPAKLRSEFNEVGALENIIARDKIQRSITHQNFKEEVSKLIEKYKNNDVYSKMLLDEIFLTLGIAMINMSAILDLEAIIISGGLGTCLGKLFEERWRELLKNHVPFPPEIVFSKMDNLEGVMGAISVGIERIHMMENNLVINGR